MDNVKSSIDLHLDFISNKNGSNPSDVFFSTLPICLTTPLTSLILPFIFPVRYVLMKYSSRIVFHVLVETVTVVIPSLLFVTLLSSSPLTNFLSLLLIVLSLSVLTPHFWKSGQRAVEWNQLLNHSLSDHKPSFITNFRAGLNFATAICILAVDFQVFPRRFVKTETYGYSLMDVGVGSFIASYGFMGISSRQGGNNLIKTIPIFMLGFLRLFLVKLLNYHEHITEYGVHWNFFFTLGFIRAFSSSVQLNQRPIFFAVTILTLYEFVLFLGLEQWILSDYPRNNIISSNREGIFSLFGYLALYYSSVELGNLIRKPRRVFKEWVQLLLVLSVLSMLCWKLLPLTERMLGKPSRRLVNTSFCMWMLTYNISNLSACLATDLLLVTVDFHRKRTSPEEATRTQSITSPLKPVSRETCIMHFINFNGLSFFLLANVLTGIANLLIDTINVGTFGSMSILLSYCCLLFGFVTYRSAYIYADVSY